jgi:hypothetical protein
MSFVNSISGISTDDQNSTVRLFELDQPSLGMDREYLVNGFDDKEVQVKKRIFETGFV